VLKVNKQLETGSKNASLSKKELTTIKNYITKANAEAAALYTNVWETTYTAFPTVVVSCTATFCVNVSNASGKAEISSSNQDLVNLAKSGSNKLQVVLLQAKRNKATNFNKVTKASSTAKKIVNESIVINANSNVQLSQIPGSQSSCN
jgi:hypothetical protein